jgi:hypothetical protein
MIMMNKAVQTMPMHMERERYYSNRSTSSSSQGTAKNQMRKFGPNTISPRPTSAHPLRRPDLNYEQTAKYVADMKRTPHDSKYQVLDSAYSTLESRQSFRNINTPASAAAEPHEEDLSPIMHTSDVGYRRASESDRGSRKISTPQSRSFPYFPPAGGKDDGGVNSGNNVSLCSKSVSFVVSLQCRDSRSGEISSQPYMSDVHWESMSQEVIERTRRDSSIVGHVDSLVLLEQGVTQETPPPEDTEKIIARTRRGSSIIGHVDSLALIQNSKVCCPCD